MTTPRFPDSPDHPDVPDPSDRPELPPIWPRQPVTHPAALSRVLDVACASIASADGTLCVLFCDSDDRLLQPIAIDTLARAPAEPEDRVRLLGNLTGGLADLAPAGSVLIALARAGGLSATDDDICWADAASRACAGRIRLLGVHVVTPDGSRPVPAVRGVA
jgi:hypothetical protein